MFVMITERLRSEIRAENNTQNPSGDWQNIESLPVSNLYPSICLSL
jgi:hypothetical protein